MPAAGRNEMDSFGRDGNSATDNHTSRAASAATVRRASVRLRHSQTRRGSMNGGFGLSRLFRRRHEPGRVQEVERAVCVVVRAGKVCASAEVARPKARTTGRAVGGSEHGRPDDRLLSPPRRASSFLSRTTTTTTTRVEDVGLRHQVGTRSFGPSSNRIGGRRGRRRRPGQGAVGCRGSFARRTGASPTRRRRFRQGPGC